MSDTIAALDGPVATLTLSRPAALNALSADMVKGMRDFVSRVEGDPAVRCVVIQGAGDHFMAGGDLKWFLPAFDKPAEERRRVFEDIVLEVHHSIVTIRRMRKPVVASVRGACAGFGLSLAMACDLVIAADTSTFTLAYNNIGVSPDGGGSYHLPRLVGLKTAMEIALLGDRFDAATAKSRGVVNFVVPVAQLEAETAKLAGRLAASATHALANAKRLLNQSLERSLEAQLQAEADSFADCSTTADMHEGIKAFIEKRKPVFQGK